ncbi:MAG TPA: tetratricopeptide repeat protein [Candidatus Paceibacterota bacterium]
MPPAENRSSRLDSTVFYLILAAVFLAPVVFWPSHYFALESVKTVVIGVLTTIALVLAAITVIKRREVKLPPRSLLWVGTLSIVSILASAIASGHFMKSFFGQGFELGVGAFLITLMGAGLAAFLIVLRRTDRAIVLYTALMASFIILWIIQILRVLIGPSFMSLGVMNTVASSLIGNWFSFGIFSAVIAVISFAGIYFLRLSSRMKIGYWVLFAASVISLIVVNSHQVWQALAVVFLGLTIYLSSQRARPEGSAVGAFFGRLAWVPLVACVLSVVFAWWGVAILGPVVTKLNAGYTEIAMPWRMTMDVAAGQIKDAPLLGAGPNRFSQAYLNYKPAAINTTDAWGVEFNAGFGLIPTYFVTQGFVGLVIWILFFVFFAMLGVKSLRGLGRTDGPSSAAEPERPYARFVIVSSFTVATLIWITECIYVPSHAIVFLGYVMTGIWLGASVAYGRLVPVTWSSREGGKRVALPIVAVLGLLVAIFFGITFLKNTVALGYFASGVKTLTTTSQPVAADTSFSTAVALNPLDVYWQARAEANISRANQLLSTITATSTASTSAAVVAQAGEVVNNAVSYTVNAIKEDPTNYNNYVSQARVAELATAMKMDKGYESAVTAYKNAIVLNPTNPSLYLSLAQLAASQQKYQDAIQAIGAALQVKSNYLDAVYLLSQVEAAAGNLPDAITAAQFATQLNPNEPLLQFQLGLLQYNKPDYAEAEKAFSAALKLSPGYANAQYFYGLTEARLGSTTAAIATFTKLAETNPDNNEVKLILETLRAGKSLFSAGPQQQAARPEKRSTPPLKQQ